MLHPVGELPAAVYWRRRLLVLLLLVAVLGGGGWVGWSAATGRLGGSGTAGTSAAAPTVAEPALARVLPYLASVQTPTAATTTAAPQVPVAPAPTAGGPCTDDMIGLAVRAPVAVPVGDKPTFELVVTNVSAVPCVRALDKALQELVLLDSAGARLWGSNDCFPEAGTDLRTIAPGEAVSLPVVWGGQTSEPTCTAPRVPPAPGNYVVRGRLDTKVSTDAPLAIG